jgi:glycosyltransferase involved in cell wall biosynthesis
MRVLITNHSLADRTGSELFVRDVALALLGRGLVPAVYSPRLGDAAAELRLRSIPVVDDLAMMAEPPDLIHGQHHLEVMTALEHFPNTPALFFCHGFLPWLERPPKHPRIVRYAAVDFTTRDRLTLEEGVDPSIIDIVPNFVDTSRFRPRGALPERPRRALVFSNQALDTLELRTVRAACAARRVELEIAGIASRHILADPASVLGDYDIVFARGRSAIEAMACGTAVIVLGIGHMGPMVRRDNLEELRRANFGVRTLVNPLSEENIVAEIDRYDAEDASAVSATIRSTAGIEKSVDRLIDTYRRTLADASTRPPGDERQAMARYLRWMSDSLEHRTMDVIPLLESRLTTALHDLQVAQNRTSATEAVAGALAAAEGERASLRRQVDDLQAELRTLKGSAAVRLRERLYRSTVLTRLYRTLSSVGGSRDR